VQVSWSVFQREGVPTPGGGRYWHVGTIRDMIRNDVYRAHARDELERLAESGSLSSEVLVGLGRNRCCEIVRYSRTRWKRTPDGEKAIHAQQAGRPDSRARPCTTPRVDGRGSWGYQGQRASVPT
jgi:hypothetical protein